MRSYFWLNEKLFLGVNEEDGKSSVMKANWEEVFKCFRKRNLFSYTTLGELIKIENIFFS